MSTDPSAPFLTKQLSAIVAAIRARHHGQLCGCRTCKMSLVAAFAQDVLAHFDGNDDAALDLLAETCLTAWTFNGKSANDLLGKIATDAHPDAPDVLVWVKAEPVTKDDIDLFKATPGGSA